MWEADRVKEAKRNKSGLVSWLGGKDKKKTLGYIGMLVKNLVWSGESRQFRRVCWCPAVAHLVEHTCHHVQSPTFKTPPTPAGGNFTSVKQLL